MIVRVEAVYENGVPRPLEPLGLSEHQRVVLTVSEAPRIDEEYIAAVREQVAKDGPPPGLDEIRRRLAKNSWVDDCGLRGRARGPLSTR